MRIHKKEVLAGIPILKIRDYLRKVSREELTASELRTYFRLNRQKTEVLIHELLGKELLEKRGKKYRVTLKGKALCMARCVPAIDKERADDIFREFMRRVEEVNRDDFYLYRVSKLLLFGSYLNPSNTEFGDIDIAFELEQKIGNKEEFFHQNELLVEAAIQEGRCFPSLWDEMDYARRLVLLKLKDRNPYISLHPIRQEKILETAGFRQIYPEEDQLI